jgi:hypothetical protein
MIFLFITAESEHDDPICRLTTDQRVRVCTLIFSSAHFDGELSFLPTESNVDDAFCVKKTISFRTENLTVATSADQTPYEEWMIRCLPKEYFHTPKSEFFASRVYNTDDVFVYRWGNERQIFVENLFTNIRFRFE